MNSSLTFQAAPVNTTILLLLGFFLSKIYCLFIYLFNLKGKVTQREKSSIHASLPKWLQRLELS